MIKITTSAQVLSGLACLLMLAFPALSRASAWSVVESVDVFTDEKTVIATGVSQDGTGSVAVSCSNGEPVVLFSVEGTRFASNGEGFARDLVTGRSRFDKKKFRSELMVPLDGGQVLGPYGAERLVAELMASKLFMLEVTDALDRRFILRFALSGSSAAISRAMAGCELSNNANPSARSADVAKATPEPIPSKAPPDPKALADYQMRVSSHIQKFWVRPSGFKGVFSCRLEIAQSRYGDIESARVLQGCDDDVLRDSVLEATANASPLPIPRNPDVFTQVLEFEFETY